MSIAALTAPGEVREFVRVHPPKIEADVPIVNPVATSEREKPKDDTREGLKRFLRFVKKSAAEKPKLQRGLAGYEYQASAATGTKGLYLDKFY